MEKDLTSLLITNNSEDKDEKIVNVYNVVSYILSLMLGNKVDENFFQMLDNFAPIKDINTLMDNFDNDHHIAMQLYRDYANILKCWELNAIQKYEMVKVKLIEIRNIELMLKFIDEQNSSLNLFFTHLRRKLIDLTKENLVEVITEPLETNVKVEIELNCNNKYEVKSLDSTLSLVTSKKIEIEKKVELLSLYVRCVRELSLINASNITKIHYHQIRGGFKKAYFKGKIILKFPISKTHYYFSQKLGKNS